MHLTERTDQPRPRWASSNNRVIVVIQKYGKVGERERWQDVTARNTGSRGERQQDVIVKNQVLFQC